MIHEAVHKAGLPKQEITVMTQDTGYPHGEYVTRVRQRVLLLNPDTVLLRHVADLREGSILLFAEKKKFAY